jgi:phosphotransferase system  glucose/maltose/N-acetylglucosamine-specific IIC component
VTAVLARVVAALPLAGLLLGLLAAFGDCKTKGAQDAD